MHKVIEEIAAERRRQVEAEGYDTAHDDEHENGEMALAAGCYAIHAAGGWPADSICNDGSPFPWPWDGCDWKPHVPRRDLIRAAALLVAEIERLDRAEPAEPT